MTIIQERVNQLDQHEFDEAAASAFRELRQRGASLTSLEPGDGTRYVVSIVQPVRPPKHVLMPPTGEFLPRFFVCTSFGGLHEWSGQGLHWDYVAEKWVSNGHEWTARVLTRYLNTLGALLRAQGRNREG